MRIRQGAGRSHRYSTRLSRLRCAGALWVAAMVALGSTTSVAHPSGTFIRDGSSAESRLAQLVVQPIPYRNLYTLTDELVLHPPRPIPHVIRTTSPNYPVGHVDTFQILSEDRNHYFSVKATIRARTPHLYLYIQNGISVSDADIQKAAQHFEQSIYPTDRSYFGSEWTPGIDGDPHITCLVANLESSGVAGYFSSEDEYPKLVNPYSNQRQMFYINAQATLPGDGDFNLTLSHEFQHMIHWHVHPHDNAWLNEGMSMLAERLNQYAPSSEPSDYVSMPDTQLNSWSENDSRVGAHYGGAYLYLSYIYDRFGRKVIKDIVADKRFTDFQVIADVFQRDHINLTPDQFFAQWAVTNVVHDRTVSNGLYDYKTLPYQVEPQKTLKVPSSYSNRVPPYGAQYVVYDSLQDQKPFHLRITGGPTVPIVSAPHAAPFWWSNKGDLSDTRLERTFDLRHVKSATLKLLLWYDVEKDYDYGYVEASTDGRTWTTLRGRYTTRSNPNGANYGNAWTGSSKGWRSEQLDLSAYAGHRVKIRFEYITDDVYTGQGIVLKNISIPEIGFHDNLSGWKASGFVPVTVNALPSNWIAQLVEYDNQGGIHVVPFPLQSGLQGTVAINPKKLKLEKIVVVLFNAVPKTTQSARWRIESY